MNFLRRSVESLVHRINSIPDDWLVLASATIPIFMVGLIAFEALSDLPEKYAHLSLISLSLVPALFIANAVILLIAIFKPDDEGVDENL